MWKGLLELLFDRTPLVVLGLGALACAAAGGWPGKFELTGTWRIVFGGSGVFLIITGAVLFAVRDRRSPNGPAVKNGDHTPPVPERKVPTPSTTGPEPPVPENSLGRREEGPVDRCYSEMPSQIQVQPKEPTPPVPTINGPDDLKAVGYIFVLGHPAAGKSTFAHVLRNELSHGFSVMLQSDYTVLRALFYQDLADGRSGRFQADLSAEFRVTDPRVYDEALQWIHDNMIVKDQPDHHIKVIEFSRPKYDSAFLHYTLKALVNSVIIHVEASLEVCRKRNERQRATLEARLSGVEPNAVFGDSPDLLHYVPPSVFDRIEGISSSAEDQRLVLTLMPSRGYLRIQNDGDDVSVYKAASLDLIRSHIIPLVSGPESPGSYYARRLASLAEFVSQGPNLRMRPSMQTETF